MGPCKSTIRALMHHHELAGGVNGMIGEVEIGAVNASICREFGL